MKYFLVFDMSHQMYFISMQDVEDKLFCEQRDGRTDHQGLLW